MLCDVCHSREAEICYTEVVNGVRTEQHLCSACAAKYTGAGNYGAVLGGAGFLASLLAGVLGMQEDRISDEDMQKTNFVCPTCHMTYNEFLRDGKFGCKDCYKTFGLILDPYIKKIQGNTTHTGKCPKHQQVFAEVPEYSGGHTMIPKVKPIHTVSSEDGDAGDAQIARLKDQLADAIAREEYEEAARLRDEIRSIQADPADDEKAVPHE